MANGEAPLGAALLIQFEVPDLCVTSQENGADGREYRRRIQTTLARFHEFLKKAFPSVSIVAAGGSKRSYKA